MSSPFGVALHGGCGVISRAALEGTPREAACRRVLQQALDAGYGVVEGGGSAEDAVVAVVAVLEDSEEFNAGRGSVFTTAEEIEMDAGLMLGHNGAVGGVTGLTTLQNPIKAAHEVLRSSPHSLMAGAGAEAFGRSKGLAVQPREYFRTDYRLKMLRAVVEGGARPLLDHSGEGTVGAVALDRRGRIAAASSTGGMTGKLPGRVSDSCIAGAGFWASKDVGISATGNGDLFIASALCKAAAVEFGDGQKKGLGEACEAVLKRELGPHKDGDGGLIAIDKEAKVAMPFNTPGMFRAAKTSNGHQEMKVWNDK